MTQAKPMRHTNRWSLADIALVPVPALYGVQELQQLCRCMLDPIRCVNACCLSTYVTKCPTKTACHVLDSRPACLLRIRRLTPGYSRLP